jgi:large subunit ribosomal protein L35
MPKMKTRKCAAKRVKKTGTGKYRHFRAGNRHLQTGKSAKRRRRIRKNGAVKATEMGRIKAALPYA